MRVTEEIAGRPNDVNHEHQWLYINFTLFHYVFNEYPTNKGKFKNK